MHPPVPRKVPASRWTVADSWTFSVQGFYPPEPLTRPLRTGLVRLEERLDYVDRFGLTYTAWPFDSDLESRPTGLGPLFNIILGPIRETILAALIHDMLCNRNDVPRAVADNLYREMLGVLANRDPDATRWENFRRRIAAPLSWVGLRAWCWLTWQK